MPSVLYAKHTSCLLAGGVSTSKPQERNRDVAQTVVSFTKKKLFTYFLHKAGSWYSGAPLWHRIGFAQCSDRARSDSCIARAANLAKWGLIVFVWDERSSLGPDGFKQSSHHGGGQDGRYSGNPGTTDGQQR